jgi:N-acetylgalactosamine-N,N'-diacetylbacillosaminyl-diphospho-undecaprenol 4-alpha-N-acetylgalactosaminyltransferase
LYPEVRTDDINTDLGKDRLCILVNSLAGGGGEKVALALYEEYRSAGLKVILLCLENNVAHAADGYEVHCLSDQTGSGESGLVKLFSLFGFAKKLKRFIEDQKITIVQSHIYRANYVNLLARRLGGKHKVQIVNHGIASRYRKQGLLGKVNLLLLRWLYPAADQLVCPSPGMLQDLNELGVVCRNSVIIGNPFDLDEILNASRQSVSKELFVFEPDKLYLISVGRLEPVKRPQDIVKVLARLDKTYPALELIFLGTGSMKEELLQLSRKLGVHDKLHFPGHVSNPYAFVGEADVFVSASEFEGFSNVIVESLISGTPVVSTDCPSGPREILSPNLQTSAPLNNGQMLLAEYGILVAVADDVELASAIDMLLSDSGMYARYIDKGKIRASEFERKQTANRYLEFFGNG